MKIIIMLIIVAALVAGGYYGRILHKKNIDAKKDISTISNEEVRQVVIAFLEAVANRDIDVIYTMATEGFKINIPRDKFLSFITTFFGEKKLKKLKSTGFSYDNIDVETGQKGTYKKDWIYEYSGIVTFTDNSERKIKVFLVREGGQWRVQYFEAILKKGENAPIR